MAFESSNSNVAKIFPKFTLLQLTQKRRTRSEPRSTKLTYFLHSDEISMKRFSLVMVRIPPGAIEHLHLIEVHPPLQLIHILVCRRHPPLVRLPVNLFEVENFSNLKVFFYHKSRQQRKVTAAV